MQAETIEAGDWWARPRGETAASWVKNYQLSLKARHRTAIVEIVKSLEAETVFEVGAHCGPNLVRLATEIPALRSIGVDVSAEAVNAGRSWVASLGLSDRVQLNVGRVPQCTDAVPTGSCDVVLSCYALAYLAPEDLEETLYEMGRIAAKAVVLAEPMGHSQNTRSMSGYTEWAHDYEQAAKWCMTWRGMTITRHPVSPPVDRLNGILVATRGE
jgi:cyclopropane fatty-acyl-phospholipid synthase-like methyltransferase